MGALFSTLGQASSQILPKRDCWSQFGGNLKKASFQLKSQVQVLFSRPGLQLAYLDSYLTFEYMGQLCQSQRVKGMRCV